MCNKMKKKTQSHASHAHPAISQPHQTVLAGLLQAQQDGDAVPSSDLPADREAQTDMLTNAVMLQLLGQGRQGAASGNGDGASRSDSGGDAAKQQRPKIQPMDKDAA